MRPYGDKLAALHTGQPIERIEEDSNRDRWFTAQEALEHGFIDRVVDTAGQVRGQGGTVL